MIGKLICLSDFLDKEGFRKESDLVDNIIIKLSTNVDIQNPGQNRNKVLTDIAKEHNAILPLNSEELTNGSDFQLMLGGHQIYVGTKIDEMIDGGILCVFPKMIPGGDFSGKSLSSYSASYNGASKEEKAKLYLSSQRKKETFGGYSLYLQELLGGTVGGGFSDETLSSKNMLHRTFILPGSQEVILLDKLDIDATTWGEVIELVTSTVAVGALLASAALSGGATLAPAAASAFNNIAHAAVLIGIAKDLLEGNYLKAALGLCLLFVPGLGDTKTISRFYASYIARNGSIILKSPAYFFEIVQALIELLSFSLDAFAGALDSYIKRKSQKMFGVQSLNDQQIAQLMSSNKEEDTLIAGIYQLGGPEKIRSAAASAKSEFNNKYAEVMSKQGQGI